MPDRREQSERYARIGMEVLRTSPELASLCASDATIGFLSSTAAKRSDGRPVLGECERIKDKYRWAIPYDFTVTIFEPNVQDIPSWDEAHLRVLLLHELMHAGVSIDRDGNEVYSIVPHDVEDFRAILERHGLDWQLRPL